MARLDGKSVLLIMAVLAAFGTGTRSLQASDTSESSASFCDGSGEQSVAYTDRAGRTRCVSYRDPVSPSDSSYCASYKSIGTGLIDPTLLILAVANKAHDPAIWAAACDTFKKSSIDSLRKTAGFLRQVLQAQPASCHTKTDFGSDGAFVPHAYDNGHGGYGFSVNGSRIVQHDTYFYGFDHPEYTELIMSLDQKLWTAAEELESVCRDKDFAKAVAAQEGLQHDVRKLLNASLSFGCDPIFERIVLGELSNDKDIYYRSKRECVEDRGTMFPGPFLDPKNPVSPDVDGTGRPAAWIKVEQP